MSRLHATAARHAFPDGYRLTVRRLRRFSCTVLPFQRTPLMSEKTHGPHHPEQRRHHPQSQPRHACWKSDDAVMVPTLDNSYAMKRVASTSTKRAVGRGMRRVFQRPGRFSQFEAGLARTHKSTKPSKRLGTDYIDLMITTSRRRRCLRRRKARFARSFYRTSSVPNAPANLTGERSRSRHQQVGAHYFPQARLRKKNTLRL